MSRAYRCDRCEDFQEGVPVRYQLIHVETSNPVLGTSGAKALNAELCEDCERSLKKAAEDWMEVNDE